MSKNILVYGAGSLGSYLATKLHVAGHNVHVVGGRKIAEITDYIYLNDKKYPFPKKLDDFDQNTDYDYVFLTSKYYDLKKNLEYLMNSPLKFDTLVLIQNTYFDNFWYYHLIKTKPFVTISVYEGFFLDGKKLKYTEAAGWFLEESDPLSRDIFTLLKNSKININFTDDINIKRAEKTIHNCSVNALSAIYDKTLKELLEDKKILTEVKNIFFETYDVLSEIIPLKSKNTLWRNFYQSVKKMDHYSSTYQDVIRNKKTEVAFLNGFIVDLGNKLGIETPYNQKVILKFKKKYPKLY